MLFNRSSNAIIIIKLHSQPRSKNNQVANREETGGIPVLGYAAATNLRHAVRLLLQIGADPHGTASCTSHSEKL
jgi:hypothetical protein